MAWRPFSRLSEGISEVAGALFGGASQLVTAATSGVSNNISALGTSGVLDSAAATTIASGLFPTSALSGVAGAAGAAGGGRNADNKLLDYQEAADNSWIWKLGLGVLAFVALLWGFAQYSSTDKPKKS